MFKKKKKEEVIEEIPAPVSEAEAEKPGKKFPSLPIGDSAAAGLIAVIFAAVGVLLCVKTCKAANPKEKKPKKPKKEKPVKMAEASAEK
ncbi:MAG: hypothetical protein IJX47_07935 [Clostridia bacterium]|nr:hypothetical protein [Clostridia bacterium]